MVLISADLRRAEGTQRRPMEHLISFQLVDNVPAPIPGSSVIGGQPGWLCHPNAIEVILRLVNCILALPPIA